jgi:predicted transposase/invertase (TIGR01784 family)
MQAAAYSVGGCHFYKSKLIVGQIGEAEKYSAIRKVICVCITNYKLFPENKEYVNGFVFCNPKNGLLFDEIPEEVYTLELPKVPAQSDGSGVWEWLQFLRSRRKEEFEMAAVKNPEIRKAVDQLYMLSESDKARAEYEWRLKCIRDDAYQKEGYYQDGIAKGAKERGVSPSCLRAFV